MKPRRVVITIDEIILHAVDNPGRAATASALERELVRIFTAQPVAPRHGGHIAHLSLPALTNTTSGMLTTGLAERIHGSVTAAGQMGGVTTAGQTSGVTAAGQPPKRTA